MAESPAPSTEVRADTPDHETIGENGEHATGSSTASTSRPSSVTDDPLQQLLTRRRSELQKELTSIQQGRRPVTGQPSRDTVNHFFSRRILQEASPVPVANVDDVEEHRPQQVTIEVQGLMQRRSVSSVLQSAHFRRSLENVVRSRLTSPPTSSLARPRRREPAAPTPPPTPQSQPAPPPAAQSTVPPPPPPGPAPGPAPEPTMPATPHAMSDQAAIMRQVIHEDFVMEISDLVHRQLVSSTLNGNFRNTLERMVMDRVNTSGTDGQAVRETLQSLPPSNIRRNDFSHLGIPSGGMLPDMDDTVSVISATANATIPYAQSNAAVNQELRSLQAQISSLTGMLKTSLAMQMDIQRSIRQEVSAAIHNTLGSQSTVPTPSSRRATDSKCIVCLEGDSDTLLYRCGHLCMCFSCASHMHDNQGSCPVCRAPIVDIIRAYRISHD